MVNRFHCEGEQPIDLSSKNQCAIANPHAYAHALVSSSVHELVAVGCITIHGKGTCKLL
jgi:hypothetical protein